MNTILPFRELPLDVQGVIFSYLESKELCRIARVSVALNALSKQQSLWEALIFRKYGMSAQEYQTTVDFKQLYKEKELRYRCSNFACDY